VTSATRVRRGGVAGFFAREYVEVQVEVLDTKPSNAPEGREGHPSRASSQPGSAGIDLGGLSEANLVDDPLSELIDEMARSGPGPSSVLDLAEKINDEETTYRLVDQPTTSGGANLSGNLAMPDPAFAAVLERIIRESGLAGDAAGISEGSSSTSATGGGATKHWPELDTPSPASAPSTGSGAAPEGGGPAPISGVVTSVAPARGTTGATSPNFAAHTGLSATAVAPPGSLRPSQALAALGLPARAFPAVLPDATVAELEEELCRALSRALPQPPPMPSTRGSVIAVVGTKTQALATARTLASQIGISQKQVEVATQRRLSRQVNLISSPEEAAEQRRGWRWRGQPAVVVVETELRPDGDDWAASVLRALEPTICWGVAEAFRKPEDLAAWSTALGGLDVLAVVELGSTTTPAAVLGAGLPIGLVDSEAATPQLWAGVLCARLGAGS
jgi:hypothetical protein